MEGRLSCLHLSIIMHSAAVNSRVPFFLCTYVFRSAGWILSGTAGSHKSAFNFLRNCLPRKRHHFIFQLAMPKGPSSSRSSSTLVIVCLSYFAHPSECEVASHCGFDFPNG